MFLRIIFVWIYADAPTTSLFEFSKVKVCRILTSLSQCGAYPQIPGRGRTGMTASFSYRGDVRTQSSVVRPWYYSRTSSVILSDCGRAAARSR